MSVNVSSVRYEYPVLLPCTSMPRPLSPSLAKPELVWNTAGDHVGLIRTSVIHGEVGKFKLWQVQVQVHRKLSAMQVLFGYLYMYPVSISLYS